MLIQFFLIICAVFVMPNVDKTISGVLLIFVIIGSVCNTFFWGNTLKRYREKR